MEFEIELDYSIEDLEAYWQAFVWKEPGMPGQKRASPRMHRNVGLTFLILGGLSWIWVNPFLGIPAMIVGCLMIYSGWHLGRPGAASRWAGKTWKAYQEAGGGLQRCRFGEDGVWVHDSKSDHRYDYEGLGTLWEDPERFYLILSGGRRYTYVLNKRRFTAGEPEDLPAFWRERTGKPVERVK